MLVTQYLYLKKTRSQHLLERAESPTRRAFFFFFVHYVQVQNSTGFHPNLPHDTDPQQKNLSLPKARSLR